MSTTKQRRNKQGFGRFKRYPAYKDSGVEWLEEIPVAWDIVPQFTVAPQWNGRDIHAYAFYLLQSYDKAKAFSTLGVALNQTLTSKDLKRLPVIVPRENEQRDIATFLDQETAKIDALIAKKVRLIELLQEKRTALITRAVTKGLDPTVAMKDSRVEWLGKIPRHWEVKPLKWAFSLRLNKALPGKDSMLARREGFDGAVSCENGVTGYTNRANTDSAGIAIERSGDLRSDVQWIDLPTWISGSNLAIRKSAGYDRRYLAFFFRSLDPNKLALQNAPPLTIGGFIKKNRVCRPPIDEQCAIAAFLDRETVKIDALIQKICTAIEFLKEYRIALICAAVTGKIDVRQEEIA